MAIQNDNFSVNLFKYARELVYFKVLVQQGSRKKAADALNIDIKTAGRYLADLEFAIKGPLLKNSESGVQNIALTPLGHRLYAVILPKIERLEIDLSNFESIRQNIVYRILAFPAGYHYAAKLLLAKLRKKFPHITFEVGVITPTMIARFGAHLQELADSFNMLLLLKEHLHLLDQDKWIVLKTVKGKFALYTSQPYLDSLTHSILNPNDLTGLNYLGSPLETGQVQLLKDGETKLIQLNIVCKMGMEFVILELIQQGLGIGILNETLVKASSDRAQLVKLLPDWTISRDPDVIILSQKVNAEIDKYVIQCLEDDMQQGAGFL
ncbi:LysR substrate-binding domain-containing protein [Caedibacter taeniospiralis]|jgi:DNA-binding transcriptional LysR family regulator|uniref:LysR substrate-binding domain-containing protein n=1 Tax=Caedibacter taeniospiralis TaxID=28907 RepID=UPI0037BE988F